MISVELCRFSDGAFVQCSAKGHALFAKTGKDIVCAAVTALLTTTLAVLDADDASPVTVKKMAHGQLVFRVPEESSNRERLLYAGDFLETGLSLIQQKYPQCIKLRVKIV